MIQCCCFIVLIFCTIDVSNGGILSGMCHASNGTCGKKGVPCNQTFGSEWTYTGKCCNERPCCKFLKPTCVPETCPEGYRLLPNQTSSTNCYLYRNSSKIQWESAQVTFSVEEYPGTRSSKNKYINLHNFEGLNTTSICASTPGANLWRPNTEQEANDVNQEFIHPPEQTLWTGANDRDGDGTFTFYKENGPFSQNSLPFGSDVPRTWGDMVYVTIKYNIGQRTWFWEYWHKSYVFHYICEYQRRVCP